MGPMYRAKGLDKVGGVAAAIGLVAFLALPFATVRHSRIATGIDMSAWSSLTPALFALVVALWLAIAVLCVTPAMISLSLPVRPLAAARGFLGAGIILTLAVLSGWAATHLGQDAGRFARVSIGGGVWVSGIAAYTVLLSSGRQVGRRSALGVSMGLLAPLGLAAMLVTGYLDDLGIMKEYVNVQDRFWVETLNTIIFAAVAVVLATAIGVVLGIAAFRQPRLERPVFALVSVFQTVPGLAMVGLLVAPLAAVSFAMPVLRRLGVGGIGWAPVVIALTLYALLAIVRNTHAGLRGVPVAVVDAGRGMGMTDGQLLRRVQIPLGMPVVFSGVRTSAVQTIGNATLGAFVGGVTLGRFIFQGLAEQAPDLTMLGSIALVAIALIVDGTLRETQRLLIVKHGVPIQGSDQ